MTSRLALGWHERSGPSDIAGFLGAFPVARAYRDASGFWVWSASWLAGIDARGVASGRAGAVRAAEEAVGGWVGLSGLVEKAGGE